MKLVVSMGIWLTTVGALLLDSYVYPGLVHSLWFFALALGFFGYMSYKRERLPLPFLYLNVFLVVLSGLLVLYLSLLEWQHFDNYVFSTWHLHYAHLSYVFFFSWIAGSLQFLVYADQQRRKWFLFLLPFLISFSAFLIRLWPMNAFLELVKEDRIVEYTQTIFLFAASFLSLLTARQSQGSRRILYFIAALGLFFVAGEEISWGQRLLNISTPQQWAEVNLQEETTLHNLPVVQGLSGVAYILLGFWGGLSWIINNLSERSSSLSQQSKKWINFFTIPWWLMWFFLPLGLHNYYQIYLNGQLGSWSEYIELLMTIGLLLLFLDRFQKRQSGSAEKMGSN